VDDIVCLDLFICLPKLKCCLNVDRRIGEDTFLDVGIRAEKSMELFCFFGENMSQLTCIDRFLQSWL